jgi:hypothetical protein
MDVTEYIYSVKMKYINLRRDHDEISPGHVRRSSIYRSGTYKWDECPKERTVVEIYEQQD